MLEKASELYNGMIIRLLIYFRLFPHIFFSLNPFKIFEFAELQRGIKFSGDEQILDIGCGSGLQTMIIGMKCKKIVGIDISKKSINLSKSRSHFMKRRINSEFYCRKIENAKFETEYFDKIFSICVIEHIPNYLELFKEAHRILKMDGQMIFSVDALETIEDNNLLEKHKKQHFVEHYFRMDELKLILEDIGFRRIEIYPVFKSSFAKNLFIKGINNNFQFGFLRSILLYGLLKYEENKCTNESKGIFLIAKCSK